MGSERESSRPSWHLWGLLVVLITVGGAAIGVGLFQLPRSGGISVTAGFDLALGAGVLLVTGWFLVRSRSPLLFDEAFPRARSARRVPSGTATANPPEPVRKPRNVRPEVSASGIPRWADPMVPPKVDSPSRSPGTSAAVPAPSSAGAIPRPRRTSAPPRPAPEEDWDPSADLPTAVRTDPEELRTPRWDPELSAERGAHSFEVLEELDRIEAELRNFVPIDPPPTPPSPVGLEDLVD